VVCAAIHASTHAFEAAPACVRGGGTATVTRTARWLHGLRCCMSQAISKVSADRTRRRTTA
jgi:hypothetical protein